MPEVEDSPRRQAIEKAFEQLEGGDTGTVVVTPSESGDGDKAAAGAEVVPPTGSEETPVQSGDSVQRDATSEARPDGRVRDESGRFTKAAKPDKPIATAAPQKATATQTGARQPLAPEKAPAGQDGAQGGNTTKPPPGWSPEAREHWGKLPREVQADVWRRERETTAALRETVEARQFHDAFRKVTQPYEGMIRAEGVEPIQAVQNLFQTVAVLREGTAMQKAQLWVRVAQLYGLDPEMVNQVYNGTAPPDGGNGAQMSVDPRAIAQHVEQRVVQQFEQRRQQAITQRAVSEVEEFGSDKEFFADVRPLMSVILDAATAAKRHMPLDEAYKLALQFHPGTSSVLQQREARDTGRNAQASTERAKLAASSIRSQPAIAPRPTGGFATRRDAIDAAWDEVAGR